MSRWRRALYVTASIAAIWGCLVYLTDTERSWLGLSVGLFAIAVLIAAHEGAR